MVNKSAAAVDFEVTIKGKKVETKATRFLMGTFPFAWAAGLALDRLPARTVRIVLGLAAVGLVGLTVWTYRTPIGGGLAP